ncbi:MAG: hypothetical protein R3D60_09090 [Paracoccaceae bacterium]
MIAFQVQTAEGVNWLGLGGFALILCLFGVLFLWFAVLPARREGQALADLGQRRGWRIERIAASGGKPTRIRFEPGSGDDWQAEITRYQNGNVQIRGMTVHLNGLRVAEGLVVIGPAIDAGPAVEAFASLGGGFAGALLRGVDDPAVTRHLSRLRAVDEARFAGVTVLGTDPAEALRISAHCAPALTAWLGHEAAPVVIVTTEGARLRWRENPSIALAEALIDLGQAMARGAAG